MLIIEIADALCTVTETIADLLVTESIKKVNDQSVSRAARVQASA